MPEAARLNDAAVIGGERLNAALYRLSLAFRRRPKEQSEDALGFFGLGVEIEQFLRAD